MKIRGIRGRIKSQAAEEISHRYRRLTRILGAKENTNLYNYTNINLKVIKICENPWNPWENKSQAAEAISHMCQGAKESPTDSTD